MIGDEQSRLDPDRHTERLREISEKIERFDQVILWGAIGLGGSTRFNKTAES
jgi:hypothetical protein